MKLACDRGGEDGRLLVLLHGMGATRHVWQPMLETASARWKGSWIAPDLRGHGDSRHATGYALGLHAADVAELVQSCGASSEIVVVGHSMGGAVALAVASGWFGITPARAFGLGIKVVWTPDDLAQMGKLAAMPTRWFETKEDAVGRYLKVSGLAGSVAANSHAAEAGVAEGEQGWRLAADSATASIGAPPMRALIAAATTPIHLARGETDPMVSHAQLLEFDSTARDLVGAGHNAMVEKPDAVWDWLQSFRAS